MKVLTALIALTLLSLSGLAQRPRPAAERPPKSDSQSGQKKLPQDPNRDGEVASSDDAVRLGTDLVNVLFTAVDRNNRVIGDIRQEEISARETKDRGDEEPQHKAKAHCAQDHVVPLTDVTVSAFHAR